MIDKMTALTRQSSKQFFCITCTAQTSSILFPQIKLTNDFETNFDLQTYLWNYLESWLSLYCQIGPKNEVRKINFYSIFLQFPVHFSNIQDNGRFSRAYLITRRLNIFQLGTRTKLVKSYLKRASSISQSEVIKEMSKNYHF